MTCMSPGNVFFTFCLKAKDLVFVLKIEIKRAAPILDYFTIEIE